MPKETVPKAIVQTKIDGTPGKVYYPLAIIDLPPIANPLPAGHVLLALSAAALNHRDLFIRQHLYPGTAFGVPLLADGVGVVQAVADAASASAPAAASDSDSGPDPDPSQWLNRRVLLNPGVGWATQRDGPDASRGESLAILGGTRATPLGTLATHQVVPAAELAACPAHLSDAQAAALPLAGLTAWRALATKSGNFEPGRVVLVTGIGGGVALFVLLFAVARGCVVWVTSADRAKIERAVQLGAVAGVSYRDADWDRQLLEKLPADRRWVDVIVDGAGGDIAKRAAKLLRIGGTLVSYGMTLGPVMETSMTLVLKNIDIRGTTLGSRREFFEMVKFVDEHKITPVVSRVVRGLDVQQVDSLFEDMKSSSQFGKLVVEFDSDSQPSKL